jgi:hypothetical protein
MRALSNLMSSATLPCVPWEWTQKGPSSVLGKANKKARDSWINDPRAQWQVYSMWEGLNETLRISKGAKVDEGNPPFRCYGLAGDYDAPVADEEIQHGLSRMGSFRPAYFERTMSGNARFLWLFEEPVTVPSREFAVAFLKQVTKSIKFDLLCSGFDRPAFEEPNRYYTNSGDWFQLGTDKVPKALVQGWVVETARTFQWQKQDVVVPLPVVWAELQKKFPQHGWEGDFVEEAQGPSFFVPGSTSPKSSIVKATGMFTFAAHSPKPFWSWSDLLGSTFVKEYETSAIGRAVEGIFHDGQKYYTKDGQGNWRPYSKEDIREHLIISRKLEGERVRGEPSAADLALEHIRHWQAIDGAAPFAFKKYGLFSTGARRFLNTHTSRVLSPAEGTALWGPGGQFPWLSKFLETLLDSKVQLDVFVAWLHRFYKSAYELDLDRGQNLFLIGPPGTGKTLLNQNILGKLMGGGAEAQDYLLGETDFNSQLFEVALWTVDDSKSATTASAHAIFSSMIKKLAANQSFQYHAKFRVPCTVEWQGRVVVTANDDEESLRIIPDLGISNLEKTILLRTTKTPIEFPSARQIELILKAELPFFARYLLDHQIPDELVGTSRYGVKSYHEDSLLREAEYSSRTNSFYEVLSDWHKQWFEEHPKEQHWEGTAFQLLKQIQSDDSARASVKLTADQVARNLAGLKSKNYHLEAISGAHGRRWKIYRSIEK